MLEVLGQDDVRTARAKGLAEPRVLALHALRNAAIPIVTLLGLQFAQLLGGAVVTETIFAWPGIGRLVVEAIFNRDFPVVQGVVLVVSLIFVAVSVIAVGVSCPVGVLVGLVAGYTGRRTDDVLMRITDIQLAVPTILLAIAVVAVLGPGLWNVILTLSVTGWTLYARLTRGEALTIKSRDFVQ